MRTAPYRWLIIAALAPGLAGAAAPAPDRMTAIAELNAKVRQLVYEGRLSQATETATEAVEVAALSFGPAHPALAACLATRATVLEMRGRLAEAIASYRRAVAIWDQQPAEAGAPEAASMMARFANVYLAQGDAESAESLYRRVVEQLAQRPGQDAVLAAAMGDLAARYAARGRNGAALALQDSALMRYEAVLEPGHPAILTALNNAALLRVAQGDAAGAEALYERALAEAERYLTPNDPIIATLLNNQGAVARSRGRFAEGEAMHLRALALYERVHGPDHPDVALCLNNLGELYRAQGNLVEAERYHQRALAMRWKLFGGSHHTVAQSLLNLAELARARGELANAETKSRRAVAIAERELGAQHPFVANGLNALAYIRELQEDEAEAERLYRRALAIRERAFGPDHAETAAALQNLASCLQARGAQGEAEQLLLRALAIWRTRFGAASAAASSGTAALGQLYTIQGRYEEALPLLTRALEAWGRAGGAQPDDAPAVAEARTRIARLIGAEPAVLSPLDEAAAALGGDARQQAAAVRWFEEALSERRAADGPNHPRTLVCHMRLGAAYEAAGRDEDAAREYEFTRAGWEADKDSADLLNAEVLARLARLKLRAARWSSAEPLLRRAAELVERAEGPEAPALGGLYTNLGEAQVAQGRHVAAIASLEQARAIREQALARAMLHVGELARAHGRPAEAEALEPLALALFERSEGRGDPALARALLRTAEAHDRAGRFAQASHVYQRVLHLQQAFGPSAAPAASAGRNDSISRSYDDALARRERAWGTRDPRLAPSLDAAALWHERRGDLDGALAAARRAFALREASAGPDDPSLAPTLAMLARLSEAAGRPLDAEAHAGRALRIAERDRWLERGQLRDTPSVWAALRGARDRSDAADRALAQICARRAHELAESEVALAEAFAGAGRPDDAAPLFASAERRLTAADPAARWALQARIFEGGASIHEHARQYQQAETALLLLKGLADAHPGVLRVSMVALVERLGDAAMGLQRPDGAAARYQEALRLAEAQGATAPELARLLERWAVSLQAAGRLPEAEQARARARLLVPSVPAR